MGMMEQTERDILAKERTMLASERTLLASERTFSAWIRTGLTGVGGGFAIVRLISFQNLLHKNIAYFSGLFLILWGIGIFIFALLRYYASVKKLAQTIKHPQSIVGFTFMIACLVVVSLVLLFIL